MEPPPALPNDASIIIKPLRQLLPAASPRRDQPPSPPKRNRISLACSACRTRKTKCCGSRPQCLECVSRVSQCQYTETEAVILKRRHDDLEALYEMLKTLPEQEASELLVRIRAEGELSEVVEQAKGGTLLVQLSLAKSTGKISRKIDLTDILNT